ncbi:MAG TPA: flavodoxin family protein [Alphaproteobacteria bacterium]|nr:flavodoxin family protein [Alphaproteobacteria bacterium]HNS44513.1 flavodoxin family protein [Alphaproteobacteria bacterium]
MPTVSVVYHSGYGHTEVIALAIGKGVKDAGANVHVINVSDEGKITDADWTHLDGSSAIVFGAPTYMGSVSGPFKMFMDSTSKRWFDREWKDKLAGGFTNSLSMSGDKLNSLFQMAVLAAQHGMLWVGQAELNASNAAEVPSGNPESVNRIGSFMGVMSQSDNVAPDQAPTSGDIKTAEIYGARIADAAKRWEK